jgi:hypothetical protein
MALSNKKLVDQQNYRKTKRGHLVNCLGHAKERSKRYNLSCDLTLIYLESIANDECPVFKTPFVWGQSNGRHPYRPSLDRVVPNLGYIQGNVVFISQKANTIKQDVTEKELYAVADWLHDKRKEVLENVKPKSVAPVSDEDNWDGELHPQHRIVSTSGSWQNGNNPDNNQGTVQREDVDRWPKARDGDSVGHGVQEMGTFVTSYDIQDNWELHPTYGWIER